ncbi:MAG TPA: hypothetical protein VK043_12185 [Burkholderiales bacterium]|nr:hypothetical protein [Burkholderiales bacterium]
MKQKRVVASLVVLLAALAVQQHAAAQAETATALSERLVLRSGLAVQIRNIGKQVLDQAASRQAGIPRHAAASFAAAVKEAFRPEALQADVVKTLAANMPREDMELALRWLETDAGRRVTRAEELAATTMDEASLRAFGESLRSSPPSGRRLKLLAVTLEASYGVESAVQIYESTALGVAIGMDSLQPAQKRIGAKRLRAELQKAMPTAELRASMQKAIPLLYAYTYRDVSDQDMAAYNTFLTSPAGQRYHEAVLGALEGALVRASFRLGQLLEPPGKKRES